MNKLEIIGNLTRDPELRSIGDDVVCSFTVAVNRRTKADHPEADYIGVSVWGKLGELCSQYLAKGRKVYCSGHPRVHTYQARSGETKAALEMTASEVEFLTPRKETEAPAAPMDNASGYTQVENEDVPF